MNLYRKQATILVNLFSSDEPINGVLLSQRSNVSLKTLKKEIDEINEGFSDKGFAIVSRTGLGYEIEVHEPVIFNEFKNETKAMFYRNEFFRNSQADMIHYIIRQVLVKDNTYINQIANDCFCSISTVNRCMIPSTVKITTPLVYTNGDATQEIQALLDNILPYLLPVLATFGIYKALGSKKMTTVRMVWLIIAVCIVLTYFGIL